MDFPAQFSLPGWQEIMSFWQGGTAGVNAASKTVREAPHLAGHLLVLT